MTAFRSHGLMRLLEAHAHCVEPLAGQIEGERCIGFHRYVQHSPVDMPLHQHPAEVIEMPARLARHLRRRESIRRLPSAERREKVVELSQLAIDPAMSQALRSFRRQAERPCSCGIA
jgi:hypothetical protein